ncbi:MULTISPECIES: hypothetical protein [Spirosoma]|uniref:Uncharacterized protein n=1 Tax=Spirosoma liriopis TaxID=2937440 RepID=A0ABT0HQU8_9BACT|nr:MULTISPECIES: hypothetical protein [Spirosoma]MCK8494534.1 hypothetical protein [Spirosoma liriopis]UHG89542.1 hypothetical protein LQ777_14950 [Spirosoma oryzicola]
MKAAQIRFFSPQENSTPKEKKAKKVAPVTGYISTAGKLVFPAKSISQLDFDPETAQFRIGTQEGKRKIKSLYVIPVTDEQEGTFELEKAAKSYSISLPIILQKGGIDYSNSKYVFTVKPFDYEEGVVGYELQLEDQAPKPAYTGKPRGRKPKASEE